MEDYSQVNVAVPEFQKQYGDVAGRRSGPAGGEGAFSRLGAAIGGIADQRRMKGEARKIQNFLEDVSQRFSTDPNFSYRNFQEMAVLRGVSGNEQVKEYGNLIKQATTEKTQQALSQPAERIERATEVGAAPAEVAQGQKIYDQGRAGVGTSPITGEAGMQQRQAQEGLSRMGKYEPLPGEGESPYATVPVDYLEGRRTVAESGLPPEEQKTFDPQLERMATLEGTRAMGGAGTSAEAAMKGIEATGGEYTPAMKDVAGKMPNEQQRETQDYKNNYLKMRQRDQDISIWKALLRDAQIRQSDLQKISNSKADLLTEQRKLEKELADIKNGRPVKDIMGEVSYEMDPQWQEMYRGRQEILDGIRSQLTDIENIQRRAESNRQLRNPSRHVDYTGGGAAPEPVAGKGSGF